MHTDYSDYSAFLYSLTKDFLDLPNSPSCSKKPCEFRAVKNTEDYLFEVVLPGYSKEDIKIQIEKNILTISSDGIKDDYWVKPIKKMYNIVKDIDKSKVSASFSNGILKLVMPKLAEALPTEITIN